MGAGVGESGAGVGAAVDVGSRAVKLTCCSKPIKLVIRMIKSFGEDWKMFAAP